MSVGNEQVFAFERSLGNTRVLVLLNFVDDEVEFELPVGRDWSGYKLVLGNYNDGQAEGLRRAVLDLRGYEGRVYLAV